ncbi:multi-sensor hybrid histidine kinase, putative [Babesia ovis]|uniref:Multi-sensor hybrid histidine kinase, putative n=1 Tax=Babesia ovis TaxID=5869 RepID=A0A9W5TAE7_BABOV|nr:multi-sensor hybrid histidine kinase, putative [Babesia ovis]
MLADCRSVRAQSPVFGQAPASAEVSNIATVVGATSEEKPSDNFEKCQLPEGALMGIIFNLEQERETYLEAVAVLHDQLLEAQEHYQQLSDSHQQMKHNLEAEVSEGWKEAERWESRYRSVTNAARSVGIDVVELQKRMEAAGSQALGANSITREKSLNSDACTVVTRGDLELNSTNVFSGEVAALTKPTDICVDIGMVQGVLPNAVVKGIHQSNLTNIHKKGSQPRQITANISRAQHHDLVNGSTNPQAYFCLTPMGSPCVRSGDVRHSQRYMSFTEPAGTVYGDWLYLSTPRTSFAGFGSRSQVTPSKELLSTMDLVFEATSF